MHWADELGDISDELEAYFREPPLFKTVPRPSREMMTRPQPGETQPGGDNPDGSGSSNSPDNSNNSTTPLRLTGHE